MTFGVILLPAGKHCDIQWEVVDVSVNKYLKPVQGCIASIKYCAQKIFIDRLWWVFDKIVDDTILIAQ
jgi:hypothetical protein